MIRTVKVYKIVEVHTDQGIEYFYGDGEQAGERFYPIDSATKAAGSSVITPSQKPDDIRREKEAKKVERISSLDNLVKSHAKKEDQMPTGRVPEGSDS